MKRFSAALIVVFLLAAVFNPASATIIYDTWHQTSTGMEVSGDMPDAYSILFLPGYAANSTVLAGTYSGVYLSIDKGFNWTSVSTGLGNDHVNALAISPNYAVDHLIVAGTGGGIFKTTNLGTNWSAIYNETTLTDLTVQAVAFSPNYAADHTLFLGTWTSGVFYTTASTLNDTTDWAQSNDIQDQRVTTFVFTPDYATSHTMYVGLDIGGGVVKSIDSGHNWTSKNTGLPQLVDGGHLEATALLISPRFLQDHTLFVGLAAGEGIYKSINSGDSWSLVLGNDVYTSSLAFSPYYAFDHIIAAGEAGGGAYISKDGGANWTQKINGLDYKDVLTLKYAPTYPRTLFAGTMSGAIWQFDTRDSLLFIPLIRK
jgi:photosystem II stability/assembly factor-like uncharacterized protein